MTVSWTRKKLPIERSGNGLAFWNGLFIGLPDLRNSNYIFVLDHSLEQQFSFYSALTFHESMHAKFYSHLADKKLLSNHPAIPTSLLNFAFFIHNLIEDGRIERLGLIKRNGSVIHHQLYSFNLLISESNWKNYANLQFKNGLDKFLNHVINQLFDLILLGRKFLTNFLNKEEEKIIDDMNSNLKGSVYNSYNPNASIKATIHFFEILHSYFATNDYENQEVQLPKFENHCDLSSGNNYTNNQNLEINFDDNLDLDSFNDFFDDPFSELFDDNNNNDDIEQEDETDNNEEHLAKNSSKSRSKRKKGNSISDKPKGNYDSQLSEHHTSKKYARIIPKSSKLKENSAYSKFIKHSTKSCPSEYVNVDDEDGVDCIDTFGNDMTIPDVPTEFKYSYKNLNELIDSYQDAEDFNDKYDKLTILASKSATYFLQLAGINLKKKDGFGNQKIIIGSQKSGKLLLSGNSLSQLLAGNRFIFNKEMPAKINITLDLVILVDLTGSMEFQVNCDGRNACRLDFVNEATVILAETLHILKSIYNLPISFSIIGYNAPDGSIPLLDVIKSFDTDYQGKDHAKAIFSWYPDGENCDARAIYESVQLLEKNTSKSENKVIFFLSDGGGEAQDEMVRDLIVEEYPNYTLNGPKDYSDAIRYASMKGIKTFIFNLESFNRSLANYDIKLAFNKYYGENFYLVENLADLITIFSSTLLEIFKKR